MSPRALDTIRQLKPPSRCTDEELIDRLMQGEFFRVIKGKLKPSPVEVMKAGPRTKQEARTIIKDYEERTNSGGGVGSRHPARAEALAGLPVSDEVGNVGNGLAAKPASSSTAGVAPSPPETKAKTPWTEIIARAIAAVPEKSIALGVGGLGIWLAYIQLGINYEFWRSQGQSLGAKDQFGYVGIIIEILLMALLPARRILKKRSETWWSFVVLLGVSFCWAASTYASWNFAARNIDDGTARRQDATQKIAKLQAERDDFARLQIIHARDGRLNAARLDGDQIQSRESQIRELQPKAGTTAPDTYNLIGKGFYTGIPTLSMTLVMIGFLGLARRKEKER